MPGGISNELWLGADKDIIDTLEESILVDMHVVCDTEGIISESTKVTAIERRGFYEILVTVTPSFNAFNVGPKFNFYSS